MEQKYCVWKNYCNNKYQCCHFCNNKECENRCKDDLSTCKYRASEPRQEDDKNTFATMTVDAYKEKLKQAQPEEKMYKISEVSKLTNQGYDFIYGKVKSGEIKSVMKGSRYFITQTELDRIMKENKNETKKENSRSQLTTCNLI